VTRTADEIVGGGASDDPTATDDGVDFLATVLADGGVPVAEIERSARAAGLLGEGQPIGQSKAFRNARKRLGVEPFRPKGGGGWIWQLPVEGKMPA
jgi:hypothetical protein